MLKPLLCVVAREKKGERKGSRGEGGRGRRWCVKRVSSYLTVTSSVNLSTRCVRMLRGMVLPPSRRWYGLLFRHAGRVELYARAPERPACKGERQRKRKTDTCSWLKEAEQSKWRGKKTQAWNGAGFLQMIRRDREATFTLSHNDATQNVVAS